MKVLRKLRRAKDLDRLIFRLREELHGNLGNMANPALYQRARVGTKKLVTDYISEVCAALSLLCDSDVETLPPMRLSMPKSSILSVTSLEISFQCPRNNFV